MINTSQLFSSKIAESTRQLSARLMYGTEEISGAIRSVQITSGACGEGNFTVGTVFSSYIEVVIDECKDALEDKELLLQIGLLIDDETVEYVDIGYYTVTKPKSSVYSTTFTAVGRITSKLNKLFDVPAVLTLKNIADAITAATGITIVFNGEVSNAVLAKDITGLTCKEALSVIAGTFGGFATEDNSGNIVVSKYNTDSKVPVNGDRMTALPEFNDYDYELNGIKVVASAASESEDGSAIEEVAFTEGEPRFAMTNEFMTADLFESFVTNTVGYIYRPGAVPLALGDPRLQPWDCLEVTDLNDNVHIVPCLNIVHTFDGGLTTTITAPGESESESSSSVAGPLAQQVEQIAYKLLIAQEAILKRLRANEILADNITGATGNFTKYLTGVKIIGDLIEAGTLKTDRLIIKGTDGKYYALSTDFSGLPNVEPVKEDAIHGSVLVKKSITADRINVTDLFAQTIEATGAIKGATIETNAGNIAGWDLQKDCLANENETILPTGWGMDIPVKVSGKLYSKPESFTFSEGASGGTDGFYPTGTTQHCIPLLEFDVTEAEYQSKTGVTLLGVVDDGNYATVLLNSNGASLKLSNTAELEAEGSSFRAGVNYASVYGAEGITLTGDVDVNGDLSIYGVSISELIGAGGSGGGGESSEYEIVDSIDEMTDPTKQYVLDGYIYEAQTVVVEGEVTSPDLFEPTESSSADFLNKRMSGTSGSVTAKDGCFVTDFIAVPDDFASITPFTARLNHESICSGNSKAVFFNSSKSRVGANILRTDTNTTISNGETVSDIKTQGDSSSVLPTDWSKVAYIRIEYQLKTSALVWGDIKDCKVTFDAYNETTEGTTRTEFVNTGEIYAPAGSNTGAIVKNTINIAKNTEAIEKNATDIEELKTDVESLKETGGAQSDTVWYAVGDSITAGLYVGADKSWVAHVMNYNGYSANSKNLGVSGIGFVRADPTTSKTIRTVVDANSFANVDLVTVAVGINDWQESCNIEIVKTEMEYCFSKILTDNPCCKIYFVTPLNKNRGTQATNWALGFAVNGLTLEQFVEQQMSVCKNAGIEVIDMTHNSVINKYNLPSMFSDNTHPTADCHKALGKELARKITFA